MALSIVLFSTAWGPAYGGINSLNADLAVALSAAGADVTCVLPGSTPTAAVNAARAQGVRILAIGNDAEFEGCAVLAERVVSMLDAEHIVADGFIGHDAITGQLAAACRSLRGGALLIMHHMHYLAYKSLETTGERTTRKDEEQQNVLCAADVVVAVGPLLADSARDLTRSRLEHAPAIVVLIPGLANVQPIAAPTQFGVFFAGRLSGTSSHVKQTRLAAAAFGRAIKKCNALAEGDPYLRLLGIQESDLEARTLSDDARREAGRAVKLLTLPFIEDRTRLLRSLRDHSAAMLLSVHEGFGLTAWEAIACGVPLVLARNSGVYRFLNEHYGGTARGCVFPVSVSGSGPTAEPDLADVEEVSERLSAIALRPREAREDARRLLALVEEHTWDAAARRVLGCFDLPLTKQKPSQAVAPKIEAGPTPSGSPNQLHSEGTERTAHTPPHHERAPTAPQSLINRVLFDIYEPTLYAYYLTREPDHRVSGIEPGRHIWLWGNSGLGKTSLLRRRFIAKGAYYYVNLAPYYGETVPSLLEYLLAAIHEHLSLEPVRHVGLSVSASIRKIVHAISSSPLGGLFHIEEVPIADIDGFREWTEAISALLLGAVGTKTAVSFALTSLDDPAPFITPGRIKIRERLHIERVAEWDDLDLAKLITLCVQELNLTDFSPDLVGPLATAATGSPRFIKTFLRRFATQSKDFETSLLLARQETLT